MTFDPRKSGCLFGKKFVFKTSNLSLMKKLISLTSPIGTSDKSISFGLLILRAATGLFMLIAHGWPKLAGFSEKSGGFSDPIGLGSPFSLSLAVFAEVICALAVVLGVFTRVAAIPLVITMVVAAFIIHGDDPFAKKEFALLYAIPFLTLVFTGAGKFSLDAKLGK